MENKTGNTSDGVEIIDGDGLAKKLAVTPRWIERYRRATLQDDPIPSIRLGATYRYRWGSPEMEAWLGRRANSKPTPGRNHRGRKAAR